MRELSENEIVDVVLDICFAIHRQYGPGLLESVYEEILCYELGKRDIPFQRQQDIVMMHDGHVMNVGFRADLIVMSKVLFELKSVEAIKPVFGKTVLTYLRVTNLHLGVIINFGEAYLRDGIKRVVNKL